MASTKEIRKALMHMETTINVSIEFAEIGGTCVAKSPEVVPNAVGRILIFEMVGWLILWCGGELTVAVICLVLGTT